MGPASHNHKPKRNVTHPAGRLAFCEFKCEKDASSDFQGVLNCFESGGEHLPVVVSEICMTRARCHDEIVVGEFLLRSLYQSAIEIKTYDLLQQDLDVVSSSKNPSNWGRDFSRRQPCSGHLVEQWLKGVVIPAIDDGDMSILSG